MKQAVLFLSGRYDSRHFSHYKALCKTSFKVAVDGGYRFFYRSGVKADLLIGDLDSLTIPRSKIPKQVEIIRHPIDKDQTDAELAIRECLKRGYRQIDLVQPSVGSLDHCFGNLMLLEAARRMPGIKSKSKLRLLSHNFEAQILVDQYLTINDRSGDTLSVIPLSNSIRYSCHGTEYLADSVRIRRGDTLGLRNRITSNRASLMVKGTAAVLLLKSQP